MNDMGYKTGLLADAKRNGLEDLLGEVIQKVGGLPCKLNKQQYAVQVVYEYMQMKKTIQESINYH